MLNDGTLIPPNKVKRWTRGEKITEGGFSSVYIGTDDDTKEEIIIKSCLRSNVERRLALENERKVLAACNSRYIVKYLGWATTNKRNADGRMEATCDLLVEYVKRGTIFAQIDLNQGSLEEPVVAALTRDLLKALDYLHERGYIHGDVKCGNALLGDDCVKLCDLGAGKCLADGELLIAPRPDHQGHLGPSRSRKIVVTGTYGFQAPEVEDEVQQDEASDIYSLGCAVTEMCMGIPPQRDPYILFAEMQANEGRVYGDDEPWEPSPSQRMCREFVHMCIEPLPQDRPKTQDLLRHPWIVAAPVYPAFADRLPVQHYVDPSPERAPGGRVGAEDPDSMDSETRGRWGLSPRRAPGGRVGAEDPDSMDSDTRRRWGLSPKRAPGGRVGAEDPDSMDSDTRRRWGLPCRGGSDVAGPSQRRSPDERSRGAPNYENDPEVLRRWGICCAGPDVAEPVHRESPPGYSEEGRWAPDYDSDPALREGMPPGSPNSDDYGSDERSRWAPNYDSDPARRGVPSGSDSDDYRAMELEASNRAVDADARARGGGRAGGGGRARGGGRAGRGGRAGGGARTGGGASAPPINDRRAPGNPEEPPRKRNR